MLLNENVKEKISSAETIYNIAKKLLNARQETEKHKEYFYTFYLDSQNNIICIDLASIGTINYCFPVIREILKLALFKNAISIIIVHNHPSKNKLASEEDLKFTEKLKEACEIMQIKLLDHIIICDNEYNSLADNCLLN